MAEKNRKGRKKRTVLSASDTQIVDEDLINELNSFDDQTFNKRINN